MSNRQPYDFGQAVEATNNARAAQEAAERFFKDASRDHAKKEEKYRVALAKEIVRQHSDEQVAWSVASDVARGDPEVAKLRMERDIAEGVRDAAIQALWRQAADRRDLGRFLDWSMRIDVAIHVHDQPESEPDPADVQTFGRRAA